ncbi:MAG: HAMP domain-containing histidine kinase [Alphaproteobacteria bacterium]|nr:HAMP domain-containing histidine kinase [Alphaproteobacteria bacterium]MBE8221015.1 HAMP domain-containing histidine kinase [Alphaproteobacteria bacterium]
MNRLFKTASLKAALFYVGVAMVAVGAVLAVLYWQIASHLIIRADNAVWRDAAIATYIYESGDSDALVAYVNKPVGGVIYRLSDSLGAYRGGNLEKFPTPATTHRDENDWLHFTYKQMQIRARLLQIDADVILLVGHDRGATNALIAQIKHSFIIALGGLALLGVFGGWVMARRVLKRVDVINEGLHKIMGGDFTARIPFMHNGTDNGDEWDTLTTQINDALSRIDSLIVAMRQVTDNLAHDLRRPLTRLRARLEQMPTTDAAQTQAALADIDSILSVFAALLSLSRMESGTARTDFETINIGAMLGEIAALYEASFEEADMRLVFVPPPQTITAYAHYALLSQAVVNLLENVLHHAAKPKAQVHINLTPDLIIEIADNGDGVPPEELSRITERFVRLDASRHTQGDGLGLSLVDAIARLHGGTLQLSLNKGLVAQIHLPQKSK